MVDFKGNRKLKTFLLAFGVVFFSYVAFLNPTFTTDSVWDSFDTEIRPYSFFQTLSGGRFLQFFFRYACYLFNKIHISKFENQYVFQILTMLFIAWTVAVLVDIFEELSSYKNRVGLTFIFLISFVNPLFIETFVYVGLELAIAILMVAYATKLFAKKHYVCAGFLVLCAVGTYQSYVQLFLIYGLLVIYLQADKRINAISVKRGLGLIFTAGIPSVISVLSINVYTILSGANNYVMTASSAEAGSTFSDVTKQVSFSDGILARIKHMIYVYEVTVGKMFGMYPTLFLFVLLIIVAVVTLYALIKKNESKAKGITYLLTFILLNIFPFALFGLSVRTSPAPRICWIIFASVSALTLIMVDTVSMIEKNTVLKYLQRAVVVIFTVVNLYSITTCELDFFIGNALDKQIVYQVQAEIDRYEAESGNKITQVCTYRSDNTDFYYEQQFLNPYFEYTYNHKTIFFDWGDVELLDKVTGNNYADCSWYNTYPDDYEEVIKENFEGKDWSTFIADEQLIFRGDTLYWAIY